MKQYFKKKTSIALISLCALSVTGLALAVPYMDEGDKMMKRGHFQLDREYTLTEINTLVEAKLLRRNKDEQVLDGVEKTTQGTFLITLSNASGETKNIELNKFAIPVEAPLPGLFGKHKKGGKFGKGRYAQNEHSFNKDRKMAPDAEQGMDQTELELASNKAEKRELRREAFLENNAITLDEMTLIAQAKLIRLNNDDLKLGDVSVNEEGGYTVTIMSTEDELISRMQLNKAGFPEFKKRHHRS